MSVAVEGIETEEQLDLVARRRPASTEVQGFLFGPAIPSSDIRSVLFASPPGRKSQGRLMRAIHAGGVGRARVKMTLVAKPAPA